MSALSARNGLTFTKVLMHTFACTPTTTSLLSRSDISVRPLAVYKWYIFDPLAMAMYNCYSTPRLGSLPTRLRSCASSWSAVHWNLKMLPGDLLSFGLYGINVPNQSMQTDAQ